METDGRLPHRKGDQQAHHIGQAGDGRGPQGPLDGKGNAEGHNQQPHPQDSISPSQGGGTGGMKMLVRMVHGKASFLRDVKKTQHAARSRVRVLWARVWLSGSAGFPRWPGGLGPGSGGPGGGILPPSGPEGHQDQGNEHYHGDDNVPPVLVHGVSFSQASTAALAAACSASFLLCPWPAPMGWPLRQTSMAKTLAWSGPRSPVRW